MPANQRPSAARPAYYQYCIHGVAPALSVCVSLFNTLRRLYIHSTIERLLFEYGIGLLMYYSAHPTTTIRIRTLLRTENPDREKLNVVLRAARFRVEQRRVLDRGRTAHPPRRGGGEPPDAARLSGGVRWRALARPGRETVRRCAERNT